MEWSADAHIRAIVTFGHLPRGCRHPRSSERTLELADKETKGESITAPGLPAFVPNPADFVSPDCVTVPEEK